MKIALDKLLTMMFVALFSLCIYVQWANPYSLLVWVLLGIFTSRLIKTILPYLSRVTEHNSTINIARLNLKDMFTKRWMLSGTVMGYVGWLLYGGQLNSVGIWIQTSHIVSLTTYGILFIWLWYKYGNYVPSLVQMCLCAGFFEFMNILCAIYLYDIHRVSTVSYSVLFGILPSIPLIWNGILHVTYKKKYLFWLGLSIFFQVFTLATGMLGTIQWIEGVGWGFVWTFEAMVWGTLLSILAKSTNVISFKYVEIDFSERLLV